MTINKRKHKMETKKILRITMQMIVFALATMSLAIAQPTNLKPHGDNSLGATVESEDIDSVTVGSTMRYFVMPDALANPGYDFSTNPGALVSTFDWWTDNTATVTDNTAENDVNIQWTATGSDVINVTELGASCNGLDTTTINVKVINKPEAGFNHATYADDICTTDPGEVIYNFPVSLSTDVNTGNIRVHLTVLNSTTSTTIFDGDLDLSDSDTQVTVGDGTNGTFDNYGAITVTMTSVSDRISRKSSVDGTLTSGADVFTYTIVRPPSTGTIYHLPNN